MPVFKRRGRDSDPSNYRAVSLLPPLGKVLDAIQSEHLLSFLETNDLLRKHQFGFLPHRSTVLQLIYVADAWVTALDRGKQPSTVFMDFKRAFDRVWHTGLLHKLAMIGVAPSSVSWISDVLTKRTTSVRVGCTLSPQHTISAGVSQGSNLGPVLFLVFINDLPSHIPLPTGLYADDALIHETLKRNTTYCERKLKLEEHPDLLMYHRYVDDAFSITTTVESSRNLLCCLNELHESLEFTSEDEKDGRLPFMDVKVLKRDCEPNRENNNTCIRRTVYRKRTFTGHYMKWNPSLVGGIRSTLSEGSPHEQSGIENTTNFTKNWPQ